MRIATVRKYRKRLKRPGAILAENPVLSLGLDLPFIVATAFTLRNAVAMSLEMLAVHMLTMLAAMFTRWFPSLWQRAIANVAVSTLAMMGGRALVTLLFPAISNSVGIYIYLMAVNGMTLLQANTLDHDAKLWPVVKTAFMNILGFTLAMVVVSVIREFFGNGSLWGIALPVRYRLSGLLLPFSGFIIAGFLLALARYVNKKLLGLRTLEEARKDTRFLSQANGRGMEANHGE